jgi:Fe-S-cluster containining protein
MKLRVLPDERFSCRSCTNCCRDFYIELTGEEEDRLLNLNWANDDPLKGAKVLRKHGGKTFMAHKSDGSCVFLNPANGLCRIHETFGGEVKPVACQLYPFQIVPTFDGEGTVTTRYDCPTVRKNEGANLSDSLPTLKKYAGKLHLPDGFDERICRGFDGDQIEAIGEFAATLIAGFDQNDQRALFLAYLCRWLGTINPSTLDRAALAGVFSGLKEQVHSATASPAKRLGIMHRFAFRTLLGLYLRRDEDILNRRAGRFGRAIAMIAFVFGFGGFAGLGIHHPRGKLRAARLFRPANSPPDTGLFSLHWRMIRVKLESLQFIGVANRGRDLITGMQSLALLYPLVMACAKFHRAGRGGESIEEKDVDYAVAAIEHSFGRSAVLAQSFVRVIESFLLEESAFIRLVRTI